MGETVVEARGVDKVVVMEVVDLAAVDWVMEVM